MRPVVCILACALLACVDSAIGGRPAALVSNTLRRTPVRGSDPNKACARIATAAEIGAYAGGAPCAYLTHATAYGRFNPQALTCGAQDYIACIHGVGKYWVRDMGTPRTWLPRYVYAAGDSDDAVILKLTEASKASTGSVVQLDRMYTLTKTMYVYGGITYRGTGIKRACSPVSTLTAPASIGATCLTVDSTTGWASGEQVAVVQNAGYSADNALYATASGTPAGATTLCLASGLTVAASAGWKVTRAYPQITQIAEGGSAGPTPGLVIEDMEIDGSSACNTATHDWRYNDVGAIRDGTARRVYVHHTPSEAFTICGSTVTDSRFEDLSGSIVHKSCPEAGHADVVARNVASRVNTVGDAVMGHSEGAFTLSANTGGLMAWGNVLSDGGEGVVGYANEGDEGMAFYESTFSNFPRLIQYDPGFDSRTVTFSANTYVNVGGVP